MHMEEFALKALPFGVLGLCGIMLICCWRMISTEQARPSPRRPILRVTFVFMVFCFVLALLNAAVQVHERKPNILILRDTNALYQAQVEIERLNKLLSNNVVRDGGQISGEIDRRWTGHFREYNVRTGKTEISKEKIRLVGTSDQLFGFLDVGDILLRNAQVNAVFRNDYLVARYFQDRPDRRGAGMYLLKAEDSQMNEFKGYYVAWDPALKRIVVGPYVLYRMKMLTRYSVTTTNG